MGRDEARSVAVWRFGDPLEPLADCIRRGGVAAIPTESSYGLAVDPGNYDAVDRVYYLKGRDRGMPLPVVIGDRSQLDRLGIDPAAPILRKLGDLWPGALSLVLPLAQPLPAAGGGGSLAVRVPAHEPLRRLLVELGRPLTATSANLSGEPPVLDPVEAGRLLGSRLDPDHAIVVDGGLLPGGPPSTLVRATVDEAKGEGYEILRHGAVSAEQLAAHERRPPS